MQLKPVFFVNFWKFLRPEKLPSKKLVFAKILRGKKVFEVTKDETFGLPSDYLVGYRRLVELVSFLFSSSYGFE